MNSFGVEDCGSDGEEKMDKSQPENDLSTFTGGMKRKVSSRRQNEREIFTQTLEILQRRHISLLQSK